MKRIFICSPFRAETEQERENNLSAARLLCRKAMEEGHAPFAPHLIYTQFTDDTDEQQREGAISAGEEFLKACDELWCAYPGDTPSSGMMEEMRFAEERNIPIFRKAWEKGEQNNDTETIDAWMTRDSDKTLVVHESKPQTSKQSNHDHPRFRPVQCSLAGWE